MKYPVAVMDFTHIYAQQPFAQNSSFVRIECSDVEGADCYCDSGAELQLRERIAPLPLCGVHFIDSGNYHYMTRLWTDRLGEPFDLVLFDRHPDMQPPAFGDLLSCGGWLRTMLEVNPLLQRVCIVGAAPELVREVEDDYRNRVSFCDGAGDVWSRFLKESDRPVYISVDKDVLDPSDAVTNWDQGDMPLGELCALLLEVLRARRMLGADICGEYSPAEALRDERCIATNNRVNERLLGILLGGI